MAGNKNSGRFKGLANYDERKNIGCKVNVKLWRELRVLAMTKDVLAQDMLNEAIKFYLNLHRELPIEINQNKQLPIA